MTEATPRQIGSDCAADYPATRAAKLPDRRNWWAAIGCVIVWLVVIMLLKGVGINGHLQLRIAGAVVLAAVSVYQLYDFLVRTKAHIIRTRLRKYSWVAYHARISLKSDRVAVQVSDGDAHWTYEARMGSVAVEPGERDVWFAGKLGTDEIVMSFAEGDAIGLGMRPEAQSAQRQPR